MAPSDDQISRFISVTGATASDAARFLQITQDNFELAVDLYMDSVQAQQPRAPVTNDQESAFEAALHRAQLANKLGLVYLHDAGNDQCIEFDTFVWNNEPAKQQLEEIGFYPIRVESGTEDGVGFISMYAVEQVPYVAIVEPTTGDELYKVPVTLDAEAFVHNCSMFQSQREATAAGSGERGLFPVDAFTNADWSEEEQMERAIRESLESGRESLEQRNILKSCSLEGTFPAITDTNAIKVAIKMPNGSRVVQAFYPTDPVIRIFQYVQSQCAGQFDQTRDFDLHFGGKRLFEHRDKGIGEMDLKNACLIFDYKK